MVLAGHNGFTIPASSAPYQLTGGCTVPREWHVFGYWPHMHGYGRHLRVQVKSGGLTAITPIDLDYDFNQQKNYPVADTAVNVNDEIAVTCTYVNTTNPLAEVYEGDNFSTGIASSASTSIRLPTRLRFASPSSNGPNLPERRMAVIEIKNFCLVLDWLATAGQPTEAQLREVAADRYRTVINLGLLDQPYSLPDEAGVVSSLGLTYDTFPSSSTHQRSKTSLRFSPRWTSTRASACSFTVRRTIECRALFRCTASSGSAGRVRRPMRTLGASGI